MGDIYHNAMIYMSKDNIPLANESFAYLVKDSSTKISELADLSRANIAVNDNKISEAQKLFENILLNKKYSDITTAYATINWMSIELNKKKINKDKIEKYSRIFNNNHIFYGTGSILRSLQLLRNNQHHEAKLILQAVAASKNVPDTIKHNAHAILGNL